MNDFIFIIEPHLKLQHLHIQSALRGMGLKTIIFLNHREYT